MNEMLDQAGYKLQIGAKVVFAAGILLSLAGCVAFIALHPFGYEVTAPDVLIGLVILIAGFLFSWFSALFVYGFGQLVENSEIATSISVHNYNRLQYDRKSADTETDGRSSVQHASQDGLYWTCPNCGTVNTMEDEACIECGELKA